MPASPLARVEAESTGKEAMQAASEKKEKKRKKMVEAELADDVEVALKKKRKQEDAPAAEEAPVKTKSRKADVETKIATADHNAAEIPTKVDWAAKKKEKKARKAEKARKRQEKLDEDAKAALKTQHEEKEAREKANQALKQKGKLTKKQKYLAAKAAKKAERQAERKDAAKSSFKLKEALTANKYDKLDPKATSCFMTGLPYLATEKHISGHFADIGSCTVQLLRDRSTGRPNGTGFITFTTAADALQATTYTGSKVQGRWIKVRLCEPRDAGLGTATNGPGEKPEGCLSVVIKYDTSISERSLKRFFQDCEVANVSCMTDRETGEFRGVAFMDFEDTAMVDKAVEKNGHTIKGHVIKVRYKMERKSEKNAETGGGSSGRIADHNRAPPVPPPAGKKKTFDSDSDAE